MRRVVITGIGAITPIGNNTKELWEGILKKRCGIGKITRFNAEGFKTSLAAEIKNYNPIDYFDAKQAKRLDKCSQYAIIAAREAFEDSKINKDNTDFERIGVFVGSGIGGLKTIQEQCEINVSKGHNRISPMFITNVNLQYACWKYCNRIRVKRRIDFNSFCLQFVNSCNR